MKVFDAKIYQKVPDGILFDTDNTLYDYAHAHTAAMDAIKTKITTSLSISGEQFDKVFKEARKEVKAHLGNTASSHSRLLYFQKFLENLGLGSQVLLALDYEQTYWRTFLSNAVLFPDVRELLDEIRLLGIPSVIVTDLTAQIQFRKIVYFGLDHFFDYIVTSEEAGYDKPHESPFLIALRKIKPEGNCYWMIGDNPVNDIQGAKEKIGAITLQKVHEGVKIGEGATAPDCLFYEFSELRNLLKKIVKDTREIT